MAKANRFLTYLILFFGKEFVKKILRNPCQYEVNTKKQRRNYLTGNMMISQEYK